MDAASCSVMKAVRTALVVLLSMGVAYVLVDRLQLLPEAPSGAAVLQPMEVSLPAFEPSTATESPVELEAPEAVEEPKQPVQSLEERGDALLFEIDALQGTPFDQAVVMPFE